MAHSPDDYRQRIRFIIKLGRALHDCGANSERIERHLQNVTTMFGLNGSFLISPTSFNCAFWQDDELDQFAHFERVEPGDQNLGRLWEIDSLVESIENGEHDLTDALHRLYAVTTAPPNYSPPWHAFAWLLTGAGFSILLTPNPANSIVAAITCLIIFAFLHFSKKSPAMKPIVPIVGALLAGLGATSANALGLPVNPPFVILSSIIIFVPGLGLAVALTEISAGHLISGTSRLVDSCMTMLKLFFGTLCGVALVTFPDLLHPIPAIADWSPPTLAAWRIWPALLALSISLGIAFNIPWKKLPWGILSAAIAYIFSKIGEAQVGMYAGMFLGAFAVCLYANLFSRFARGPGSVLITTGIILLVPGSKVFFILNQWVLGDTILPTDSGAKALMAFVALIAGLLFSNAIFPPRKSL